MSCPWTKGLINFMTDILPQQKEFLKSLALFQNLIDLDLYWYGKIEMSGVRAESRSDPDYDPCSMESYKVRTASQDWQAVEQYGRLSRSLETSSGLVSMAASSWS